MLNTVHSLIFIQILLVLVFPISQGGCFLNKISNKTFFPVGNLFKDNKNSPLTADQVERDVTRNLTVDKIFKGV